MAAAPATTLYSSVPAAIALGLLGLWVGFMAAVWALAPASSGTEELSLTAEIVSTVFWMTLLVAVAGLAGLRRWGLAASAFGGVVLLGASALCSLGGHTGSWLVSQYLAGAVILGASRAALRRF